MKSKILFKILELHNQEEIIFLLQIQRYLKKNVKFKQLTHLQTSYYNAIHFNLVEPKPNSQHLLIQEQKPQTTNVEQKSETTNVPSVPRKTRNLQIYEDVGRNLRKC